MPNIAIIAATFHQPLTDQMIAAATSEIKKNKAKLIGTYKVTGSFELPLIADRLLAKKSIDAIVALGFIEKGETLHGEVMGHVVYRALIDLQIDYNKPIGLGIIGPGATPKQAEVRKIPAARAAVKAVINSLRVLKEVAERPL